MAFRSATPQLIDRRPLATQVFQPPSELRFQRRPELDVKRPQTRMTLFHDRHGNRVQVAVPLESVPQPPPMRHHHQRAISTLEHATMPLQAMTFVGPTEHAPSSRPIMSPRSMQTFDNKVSTEPPTGLVSRIEPISALREKIENAEAQEIKHISFRMGIEPPEEKPPLESAPSCRYDSGAASQLSNE
jgi:hypothetical protein